MEEITLENSCILIVDDEQANIDVLHDFLDMKNYTNILTTKDSRQVVELYKKHNPDIIILDLMMPYLNGFQILELLKNLIPAKTYLPILILTADVSRETKLRALESGAMDFLIKPFDLLEADLRIKNLLLTRILHEKLREQNLILEEKVKERTFELDNTIIQLKSALEKAQASDRLKTAFINNISHEIRTPLNGILGSVEFISQDNLTYEDRNEYLDLLNQSSNRLINTVTNFLDVSMIASGNQKTNLKRVEIGMLINDLYDSIHDRCVSKNLEILAEIPDNYDQIILTTDCELLQKSLSHILDNAIKFTNYGSITIGFEVKDKELEIYVKDTGKGISKESQNNIFFGFTQEDPFSTRYYEGAGLGLTISKGFINLLGGSLRLESEQDKGTNVFVTLGVEMKNNNREVDEETVRPETKLESILIVEDDMISYRYLEALLKEDIHTILHAKNGQEAIEICKQFPMIRLVLMDIVLPIMNGFDASKEIKSLFKDMIIIAITSYTESGREYKLIEAGIDDYILKPYNIATLKSKIKKYF